MTQTLEHEVLSPVTTEYEPTAQDRIQRVLYRLDSGEQLVKGRLRINDNFCVLGMFLDEFPGGHWNNYRNALSGDSYYNFRNQIDSGSVQLDLTPEAAEYYGFIDPRGTFEYPAIPDRDLQNIIYRVMTARSKFNPSLGLLNDNLIHHPLYGTDVNSILARLIRSGALFRPNKGV